MMHTRYLWQIDALNTGSPLGWRIDVRLEKRSSISAQNHWLIMSGYLFTLNKTCTHRLFVWFRPSVGLKLAHHQRRWASIKTTLGHCLVLAGQCEPLVIPNLANCFIWNDKTGVGFSCESGTDKGDSIYQKNSLSPCLTGSSHLAS